jgi:hypothetical protein
VSNAGKTILPITLAAVVSAVVAAASEPSAFDRMLVHYEAVRQALLHDTTDGVAEEAAEIERLAETVANESEPAAAGVGADDVADLQQLLPSLREAAARLARTGTVEGARGAFGDLSKEMVRYRQMTPDPEPVVVFCPMVQKVWLQPGREIGNPYHGQSMPRCGEIVSE